MSAPPKVGRPEVGPNINVRLPQDLLEWVDQRADAAGKTRAEAIRDCLSTARDMVDWTARTQKRSGRKTKRVSGRPSPSLQPSPGDTGTPGEYRKGLTLTSGYSAF